VRHDFREITKIDTYELDNYRSLPTHRRLFGLPKWFSRIVLLLRE